METLMALSGDQNATVRSGVLEALGEVIYTFVNDPDGPPQELLDLFLTRKGNQREMTSQSPGAQTPRQSFYSDPKRPLICAFNFPAVALTLGSRRWVELRADYLDLASDSSIGVRRTLAASLGELAKIINSENAQKDLIDVWRTCIKTDDEEVRLKAIESFAGLMGVVGREVGKPLVQQLLVEWNQGNFRGWRERESIEKCLVDWVQVIGLDTLSLVFGLLKKGLEDNVASVREAAVSIVSPIFVMPVRTVENDCIFLYQIPKLWPAFASQTPVLVAFYHELEQLAKSSNYRRRMTYVVLETLLVRLINYNLCDVFFSLSLVSSLVNKH